MEAKLIRGDCLEVLREFEENSVDLIYLDPPFFSQRVHSLRPRDTSRVFSFSDLWKSHEHYAEFIGSRLNECFRVLAPTGSLFFHCDRSASHIVRALLDHVAGTEQFRAEIIWCYRRWSNAQNSLMPSHQTIYFYSKTREYKFRKIYTSYSTTTNVDQILQSRRRDQDGKVVYARDDRGNPIVRPEKAGVPLSDVWEIPFLNPKAKERTGYPTQKPLLLLERIIELATDPGDLVVDPFCGSGTAVVAATQLGRRAIGIDVSSDALEITSKRLKEPIKSGSKLLENGREAFENADQKALQLLSGLDIIPVHRNRGMDALLRVSYRGGPVPIRVQRDDEPLAEALEALYRAGRSKSAQIMFLVRTTESAELPLESMIPREVAIVDAPSMAIPNMLNRCIDQDREGKAYDRKQSPTRFGP